MAYSDEVLADAPLAYWRLGEPSGTTMTDSSGNGRSGSYSGSVTLGTAGLLAGDADTCADFVATSGYASVSFASWMTVAALTVECLVQFDTTSGERFLIARDNASGNRAWNIRYQSGTLYFHIYIGGTTHTVSTTTPTIAVGTTYHIAGTYDGTTQRLYVDGVEQASKATTGTINNPTQGIHLARSGFPHAQFDGKLDEVAFYGSALSAARIAAHHAATSGPVTPSGDLVATLPAVTASLTGTSTPPSVSGSLAATLPPITAAMAGGSSTADITGSLAATVPTVAADLTGVVAAPGEITGTLTGTLPGLQAAFTGRVLVTDTDLTYSSDGYGYDGTARVVYDPPVVAEPAGLHRVKVKRVHQSLPAPTLVNGRPT